MKRGVRSIFLTKPVRYRAVLRVLIQRALKSKTLEVEVKQLHERLDEKFSFDRHPGPFAQAAGRHRSGETGGALARHDPDRGRIGYGQGIDRAGHSPGQPAGAGALHLPSIAPRCRKACSRAEIFGHERGAFTGAAERRIGRFESADGGTLFLDEISEISPATQVETLLRFLETKAIERVGGSEADQSSMWRAGRRDQSRRLSRWFRARESSGRTSFSGSTSSGSCCPRSATGPRTSRCSSRITSRCSRA